MSAAFCVSRLLRRNAFVFGEAAASRAPCWHTHITVAPTGAADSRGRYATFSYLAGSIPAGGAWRDERGDLFDAMDVPLQVSK